MASKSEAPKSILLHLLPLRKRQGLQNSEENFIFLFSQGRAHVNTFKKDWNLSANQERAFQTLSSNIYSRDGNNLEILPFSYPCFFYAGVIQKLLKSKNPCGFVTETFKIGEINPPGLFDLSNLYLIKLISHSPTSRPLCSSRLRPSKKSLADQ